MTSNTKRSRAVPTHAPTTELDRFVDRRRAARAYAEAWYQALRVWKLVFGEAAVMSVSYAAFRSTSSDGISTLGEGGTPSPTTLITPMGEVGEAEVGRIITQLVYSGTMDGKLLGKRLEALRSGKGLSSLIHDNGRGWNGPTAPEYARAVLSVGVRLGDAHAEYHLRHLPFVEGCTTVSVDSEQSV